MTKKVPLGKPLPVEDEETTEITPEDIEQAKKFWRQNVPDEFEDLLDALLTNEGE